MEGHFQAAEATLEGMRRQLSEDWQVGQSSLRKELQEEFWAELLVLQSSEEVQQKEQLEHTETKPSLSLRPGAPEFIPSSLPPLSTGADSFSIHRAGATQRPLLYNGHSSYLTQFRMLAHLNHWSKEEKATLLAVSLRGVALTVLSSLPAERRSDYQALVSVLENHFGTAHQAELHRMKEPGEGRRHYLSS